MQETFCIRSYYKDSKVEIGECEGKASKISKKNIPHAQTSFENGFFGAYLFINADTILTD